MFRGRHDHTIDKKGRLSVPSGFRNELQERSKEPPILTNYKDHLALYPAEDWKVIEDRLRSKSNLRPNVAAYQRFIIAGATECPIDAQGRILIPAPMRNHAQLKTKVTVAGVLDKIEIWDTTLFDEDKKRTLERLFEIQQSVDESPSEFELGGPED